MRALDRHPGDRVFRNHPEPFGGLGPFVQLYLAQLRSVRYEAGQVHGVHVPCLVKTGSQFLLSLDFLRDGLESRDAHSEDAIIRDSVTHVDFASPFAAFRLEISHDRWNGRHRFRSTSWWLGCGGQSSQIEVSLSAV